MKVLIYCTMAKPYLMPFWKEKETIGYMLSTEFSEDEDEVYSMKYNGSVCFECECKEAFEFVQYEQDEIYLPVAEKLDEIMTPDGLSNQSCLTPEQLKAYGKGKDLYAYHFENVKPIDPMPITKLYRDGTMVYPLTRAPQSYCFAYRKVETTKEDYLANVGKDESRYYLQENGKFFYSEKFLVFSIRSPWVCKIANGNKNLEVRKTRIANAGIEYK